MNDRNQSEPFKVELRVSSVKGYGMKVRVMFLFLIFVAGEAIAQQAINPDFSPYNPINNQYNPDNSIYNPRNSPYNPDNSPYNTNSTNGVFDNRGNRIGYEVQAPSGVTNVFDNQGNRVGYVPSQR